MREDVPASRPQRFSDADLARAFRHRHQHDVHHADAADHQRQRTDEVEDKLQTLGDAANHGLHVAAVADVHRAFVARVEMVPRGQKLAHLAYRLRVQCGRQSGKQKVVHRRSVGRHGLRNEHGQFVRIEVVRDLGLVRHHADNLEREAIDAHRFAHRRNAAEQAASDLVAEETDPPPVFDVFAADEAAAFRRLGPHNRIFRSHAAHACRGLPQAVGDGQRIHVFGAHIFQRAQLLNRIDVFRFQHDSAARSLAAGLHAGLPAAHDDGAFGERVAESVHDGALKAGAVRHQQHDGDDAP